MPRRHAQVAELVDALVSGTSGESRGGSSPLLGTKSRGVFVQNHPEQTKYRTSIPNRPFGVVRERSLISGRLAIIINCSDTEMALKDMFLPRYSGVRPAMSPATNTAQSNGMRRVRYGAISALARRAVDCRS
jgi:hypothetical protein